MVNSTQGSYFTFSAYSHSGPMKHVFFFIVLLLYMLIVFANLFLIVLISVTRSLHEPMYVFMCSLFVNELFCSMWLFPFLLVQILSDTHNISASFCFLQIFCVYSYGSIEYANLVIMAYDRYLAICFPLQYNTRMTTYRVVVLISLSWLFPFLGIIVVVSLIVPLQFCGNIINKVYCDNYSTVKLACSDTTIINIYGIMYASFIISCPSCVIFYTYMQILKVCFSGSKQTRQKAFSTCTPHLASLLNFSCGAFFEIIQSRFNMSSVPNMLRIFLSLYFLTCQPLFNPVMYGLNITKIRSTCRSLGLK
ncbi:olfactory receptor 4B13-like [Labrus bergylta]|uniref:olfactory receptor 4B13-like n=1 Tax=Labrus bergylta TaxID=56723 RepID=UPI00331349FE